MRSNMKTQTEKCWIFIQSERARFDIRSSFTVIETHILLLPRTPTIAPILIKFVLSVMQAYMMMHYKCASTVCVFTHAWTACSRSLKTHLRLCFTRVPSSSELSSRSAGWLMLQLLCLRPKSCQTGAITLHCPPPLPVLLNSTHMSLIRERPEWRCWSNKILIRSLPPSLLSLSLSLPHTDMQRDFAICLVVQACTHQDKSTTNAL